MTALALAISLSTCGGNGVAENNIVAEDVNAMMNQEELPSTEQAANISRRNTRPRNQNQNLPSQRRRSPLRRAEARRARREGPSSHLHAGASGSGPLLISRQDKCMGDCRPWH